MSKIKILLEVVNGMRSLADSLETMANAMSEVENQPKSTSTISTTQKPDKPTVTHEILRELAVKLSRSGKREEIKQLIEKYGVKNITAVSETDLDAFYADLQKMEVE